MRRRNPAQGQLVADAARERALRVFDRDDPKHAQRRGRTHGLRPSRVDGGAGRYDASAALTASVGAALGAVMAPNGHPIFPAHVLRSYVDFNQIPIDAAPDRVRTLRREALGARRPPRIGSEALGV